MHLSLDAASPSDIISALRSLVRNFSRVLTLLTDPRSSLLKGSQTWSPQPCCSFTLSSPALWIVGTFYSRPQEEINDPIRTAQSSQTFTKFSLQFGFLTFPSMVMIRKIIVNT